MKSSRRSILKAFPAALLVGRAARAQMGGKYNVGPTRIVRNKAPNGLAALWPGPQLFIDDYMVLKQEGLARTTHHPRRLPHPVLTSKEFATCQAYLTVVRDAERGVFRMWYNAWVEPKKKKTKPDAYLAYAESKDGVEWQSSQFPFVAESSLAGKHNLLMRLNGYGGSVIDEGPAFADKPRRFKLGYYQDLDKMHGLSIAFSSDGLRWTPFEGNPVISGEYDEDHELFTRSACDEVEIFWDPLRKRYGSFVKTKMVPEDGFLPSPKISSGVRRVGSFSVSPDFLHWELPWRAVLPEQDESLLDFVVTGATVCRGGLLVGCARPIHTEFSADPGGPAEGVGFVTLVTSRDGESWERHRDVFLNRNLDPTSWDHAIVWMGSQLNVGDETYYYYGGYRYGWHVDVRNERQIGMARLRRDGYVSRDAFGPDPGWLMTPLIKPEKSAGLTVNAEASRGEVRVQVRDQRMQIVPGFSFTECMPSRGDGLQQQVRWSGAGDPRKLAGIPCHLEFRVADARLYGFELA